MAVNRVEVLSLKSGYKIYEKKAEVLIQKTFKVLKKRGLTVDVFFIGGKRARFLNKKYRGKDKPADILSFREVYRPFFYEGDKKKKFKSIGEIYLNGDLFLKKRSSWERFLIHGLLHLLGYEHYSKSGSIMMEKEENKLWEKISLLV